jgi:hypothetical protein
MNALSFMPTRGERSLTLASMRPRSVRGIPLKASMLVTDVSHRTRFVAMIPFRKDMSVTFVPVNPMAHCPSGPTDSAVSGMPAC